MKQPTKLYGYGETHVKGSPHGRARSLKRSRRPTGCEKKVKHALTKKRRIFHNEQGRDGWEPG